MRILVNALLLSLSLFTAFIASAADVTVLTNHMMLEGKRQLIMTAADQAGLSVDIVDTDMPDNELKDTLQHSRFLVLDLPRPNDMQAAQQRLQDLPLDSRLPMLAVARNSMHFQQLSTAQAEQLHAYFRHGGADNIQLFFTAAARLLANQAIADLPPARELPSQGAYHPDYPGTFTDNPDDILLALNRQPHQPVVALGFHVRYLESNAMDHIDQLVRWVEAQGAVALPVFYSLGNDVRLVELLQGKANALIHLQPVYHNGLEQQLNSLGIPVLQGIGWWNNSIENWEQHPSGLSLATTPLYLALPEQNGLIDPLVMWSEQEGELQLIDYQAKAAINKAVRLAKLQLAPVSEHKVAVMVYNYPPGEKNLSASFMNVPRSLALLSERWQQEGYQTQAITEQTFITKLGEAIQQTHQPQAELSAPTDYVTLRDYEAWFATLPQSVQTRINQYWGAPEQSSMVADLEGVKVFPVPTLRAGNIVYLSQPPRGEPGQDDEKAMYHDMRIPVNHYYLATYFWVRNTFEADALVHFGTHGTQEWIAGKERGLSIYDDSYLVLGDMPIVYPYIIDDVGEAVQAKRRGRAVTVSHQTPPFQPSGLHGQLVDMHQLIHQWETLEPGEVKNNTVERLLALAAEDALFVDLHWDSEAAAADPDAFILHLHDYLHELAAQSQPIGLHTYADDGAQEQKLTTVMQMLGDDFLQALNLEQTDEVFVDDYQQLKTTKPYRWLEQVLFAADSKVSPALPEWQAKARAYYDRLNTHAEWTSLNTALQGGHVAPGIGADPVRVPDSLPSGKNLVGFDPSRIPTREAWLAGKKAIDEMIAQHKETHGEWPERLAFSLWAVEAMRHGGILESQAFYAMGVKPVWGRGGRVTGYEVVPQAELNRPRVDVVLSVTGLYRDQFPNVMAHLSQAAAEVAQLDEPNNPVYDHTQQMLADLIGKGIPSEEAATMAQTRVFGSPTGVYTTGLEDASLATDSWEEEEKLAKLYLQRMSHAFGPDPSQWGAQADFSELYAENLKTVDAALLARTSNLYGMLTTDDPFQYLGGIDLAVRHLTGKSPELYISNQRKAGEVRFQGADEFLAMEMATRAFHPGWVEALKEEGFAGALSLQDMTNNLWGWQVVSPNVVQDHQWQKMHEVYVMDSLDLDMNEWFQEHSAEAQLRMMERMLDAIRKGYWDASEQTKQELTQAYMDSLAENQLVPAHEPLAEFADQMAAGFGLAPLAMNALNAAQPAPSQANPASEAATNEASQEVTGQRLEQTQQQGVEVTTQWWWLAFIFIPLLLGALRQYTQSKRGF
ncbi:cobaltochelatase subunit CobN [Aliidiomarina taiwanensis]|uniref:Cobaltochelatase subunit CobN n=1 Tax=Aliidiomarina taiwanensis TaxID=946228 RepID=A0A432X8H0_9GAMM|nr:cobaltochelatase subunit CobN [Aliidiomarina taiwanensis]RUO43626.1 cobaltochelatase subunit CobN [Aliidiomarina taiwanensis]